MRSHSLISINWIIKFCLNILTNNGLTSLISEWPSWIWSILCPRRKGRTASMRLSLSLGQLYFPSFPSISRSQWMSRRTLWNSGVLHKQKANCLDIHFLNNLSSRISPFCWSSTFCTTIYLFLSVFDSDYKTMESRANFHLEWWRAHVSGIVQF